jgi:hypothetical protein
LTLLSLCEREEEEEEEKEEEEEENALVVGAFSQSHWSCVFLNM